MACCLKAPSHYSTQSWLVNNKVHWQFWLKCMFIIQVPSCLCVNTGPDHGMISTRHEPQSEPEKIQFSWAVSPVLVGLHIETSNTYIYLYIYTYIYIIHLLNQQKLISSGPFDKELLLALALACHWIDGRPSPRPIIIAAHVPQCVTNINESTASKSWWTGEFYKLVKQGVE